MRVRIRDVRLFVEVLGQEWALEEGTIRRHPVVIGLHGGPGFDGTKLRYQLAPLADIAQLVVPDQRGHGRSDRGTAETWNLAHWAEDVKGLSEALEIERPVVLGISFGGFVAQQYAARYPERPAGMILLSTGPRFAGFDETAARFRELGGAEAEAVFRRDWEDPEEAADDFARVCVPLLRRRGPDPILTQISAGGIKTMDVNYHFMAEGKRMDLRPQLRSVRCPTLVVLGEHDPLIPVRLGEEIVEAIPSGRGRLEVIPDASHDIFSDNPRASYGAIRRFLVSPPLSIARAIQP